MRPAAPPLLRLFSRLPTSKPPPPPPPPHSSESTWINPCPPIGGSLHLPKQSDKHLCHAAGLLYVGRKFSDDRFASQCCVKSSWTCSVGSAASCKSTGLVRAVWLDPNCCVAPVPDVSPVQTWAFGVPGTWQECMDRPLVGYYMHAFWTGKMCVTMASRGQLHIAPKCRKMRACPPGGIGVGNGFCCGLL
mmetsp:Transcript_61197/g.158972  ORF Transcript_61197/g.158972 Transcript_61197/m.158972 type:complete len:190 (-) Transcript_61197:186-755(-)